MANQENIFCCYLWVRRGYSIIIVDDWRQKVDFGDAEGL
jgi:hypothetical protein